MPPPTRTSAVNDAHVTCRDNSYSRTRHSDGCVLADASQAPRAKHAAAGIVSRGGASDMPHAYLPLSVLMRRLVPLKPALE